MKSRRLETHESATAEPLSTLYRTVADAMAAPAEKLAYVVLLDPDGIPGQMLKTDVDTEAGGISLDPDFYVGFPGFRAHQVRLEGGDCSTDTFCFV